jgi:hypothetical protein
VNPGLHRPGKDSAGGAGYGGDEDETLVAPGSQGGPRVQPAPPSVYRSQLDAPPRIDSRLPLLLAGGLHALVLALALILPRLGHPAPLRKPIVAHLLAQGKPRDKKLMPLKEEPAPAAARPPAAAPPPTPAKVAVAPPAPSAPARAPAPSKAAPRPRTPSREELMEKALASATRGALHQEEKHPPREREGSEEGSLEGTASSEEGDAYFAAVHDAILANYALPSIISERDRMSLKATVVAFIARDGTIVKHTFEQRSGNRFFDDALELALKRSKVPPPPADRAQQVRDEGVALVFSP